MSSPPPPRGPSGYPAPTTATDEALLKWVVENPKANSADFTRAHGFTKSSGHRAWTRIQKAILAQRAGEHRARTPAARLPEQDRETVLATVRHAQSTLLRLARRLDAEVEKAEKEDRPARLDRDTTQAMLSLQRATAGLIETHPGLLELAREAEDEKATDDDLDGILAALGVPAEPGPGGEPGAAPGGS